MLLLFFLSFQLWWSLKKEAVVIKAETIRKNELTLQLLPASLTSRKLGQVMSIGGPTSWVISSFCFRLLLWPSVITPCSRHTSGETKLFKMRWIKQKEKKKNTMIIISTNCSKAHRLEKAIFVVCNQTWIGWCLGTLCSTSKALPSNPFTPGCGSLC